MSPISVTASNLVFGPARLYVAPYGTAMPADSAVTPSGPTNPPPSPWADVGGTDGGVAFSVEGTYTDLVVDQVIMPVGSRLTDLKMAITTKLSEVTLANLTTALNSITSTGGGTGYSTLDITVTSAASQPTYISMILDGWAPLLSTGVAALRRIEVFKALSAPKVNLMYDRKNQASYDCTFNIFFISNSVNPVHVIDQTQLYTEVHGIGLLYVAGGNMSVCRSHVILRTPTSQTTEALTAPTR